MDITNRRHLHAVARDRLEKSREVPKIALIYGGIVVVSSFLTTAVNFAVGHQMSNFGGLSNLGTRSILATIQNVLPLVLNFVLMALELGFLNAMLRVSRLQYASPQSLRMGFERFWPLLKVTLLQSGLYLACAMAAMYLSMQIFLITPLSRGLMDILSPVLQSGSSTDMMAMLDDPAMISQMGHAVIPLFILMGVVTLAACLPIFYHYRMVNYVIIDKPGIPALMAMRESWVMMKHNCGNLFRLDLSMWWYFIAAALALVLGYGDMILNLMGVTLPMSGTVSYFLFYVLYLVANLAVILFLRPHVEVSYALAYDALKPQPPKSEGAVLGNIFTM